MTDIFIWLDLNWASVLYAVDQMTLAGGGPGSVWPIASWYVVLHDAHKYQVPRVVRTAWFDVTGEVLP